MNDDDKRWEEPLEDNGLTLGPEETLQREIEKSKSLKVDRLRLKDEIEKLKEQKENLQEKNRQLHKRINALSSEAPDIQSETHVIKKNELIPFLIALSLFSALFFLFRN
ncbi:MAG: seryl-tRNA synthetase [Nitrospinales bacterium]|jgi:seryl-tRNA synthetase